MQQTTNECRSADLDPRSPAPAASAAEEELGRKAREIIASVVKEAIVRRLSTYRTGVAMIQRSATARVGRRLRFNDTAVAR